MRPRASTLRPSAADATAVGPGFNALVTHGALHVLGGPSGGPVLPAVVELVAELREAGTSSATVQRRGHALRVVLDRDGGAVIGTPQDFAGEVAAA